MSTREPLNDGQFLNWIADSLVNLGDSEHYDHIRRLRTMAIAAKEPVTPAPTGFEASWEKGEIIPAGTRVRYVGVDGEKGDSRDPDTGDLGTVLENSVNPHVAWDHARDAFHGASGLCKLGHGWAVSSYMLQIAPKPV